jgi:hypothetical protein
LVCGGFCEKSSSRVVCCGIEALDVMPIKSVRVVLFPISEYRIQIKQRVILGIKIKMTKNRKAKEASVCKGR